MKVTIDRSGCISCAVCWESCPDFFDQNQEDSWSEVQERYRTDGDLGSGEAPEDLRACVSSAEEGCPVGIIHVER